MKTIIFLLLSNVLLGQVHNPHFELWDLYNGREKPAEWFCPNLCPSTECGPCDKINEGENDYAVRIHNVMPCVSSDNQAKSRSAGFIEDFFFPTSNHFRISFDVIIDSIEAPAVFTMTVQGKGLPPSGLIWEVDSLLVKRIEKDILLDHDYDSVRIRFESKGFLKQNPAHDCDLGYISAIVDSIETENIVNTNDFAHHSIAVYPNPFTDAIRFENRLSNISWILFDYTGRPVYTGNDNEITGLNALQKGLYVIQVKDGKELYFAKVIKE